MNSSLNVTNLAILFLQCTTKGVATICLCLVCVEDLQDTLAAYGFYNLRVI